MGEGTYGCVYTPSLRCMSPDRQSSTLSITKVQKLRKKIKEEEIAEMINKFDPDEQYFISKTEKCDYESLDEESKRLADTCSQASSLPGQRPLVLTFTNGGKSLYDYTKELLGSRRENLSIKTVIGWFKHLSNGLGLLHDNNIFHFDIKPDNIVIKKNESGSGYSIRFIDFGLSQSIEDIMKFPTTIYSKGYPYWPPELFYLMPVNSIDSEKERELLNYYSSSDPKTLYDWSTNYLNENMMYPESDIKAIINDAKKYLSKVMSEGAGNHEARLKYYAVYCDFYALGISLLETIFSLRPILTDMNEDQWNTLLDKGLKEVKDLKKYEGQIKEKFYSMLEQSESIISGNIPSSAVAGDRYTDISGFGPTTFRFSERPKKFLISDI
jgi:serine/threonine protein kinase